MAASILSAPGSKFGPCVGQCGHRDCAATRTMADSLCHYCAEPIGYEKRYYSIGSLDIAGEQRVYAHARCVEDRAAQS